MFRSGICTQASGVFSFLIPSLLPCMLPPNFIPLTPLTPSPSLPTPHSLPFTSHPSLPPLHFPPLTPSPSLPRSPYSPHSPPSLLQYSNHSLPTHQLLYLPPPPPCVCVSYSQILEMVGQAEQEMASQIAHYETMLSNDVINPLGTMLEVRLFSPPTVCVIVCAFCMYLGGDSGCSFSIILSI